MKINILKEHLALNKFEKISLNTLAATGALVFATGHVTFICNLFGIQLDAGLLKQITDIISAGGSIASAFAAIFGITIPGWILAMISGSAITAA